MSALALPVWDADAPLVLIGHGEYQCPGCRLFPDYPIVCDVYGCDAGRHCTQATPEQRVQFEKQIAERVAGGRQDCSETT